MTFNNLRDVYVEQLKDMYSAEKQLTEALPKMVEAASDKHLKEAFRHHLEQTKTHMETVRTILDEMDENPTSTKCKAMEGLITEGDHIAKEDGHRDAKDAALIVAAQKVEHYEIATYGSLHAFAKALRHSKAADTIQNILNQEYEADQKLDDLAMGLHSRSSINAEAQTA